MRSNIANITHCVINCDFDNRFDVDPSLHRSQSLPPPSNVGETVLSI